MQNLKSDNWLVWATLGVLVFQPIADFITHNFYQNSFSLFRCGLYFCSILLLMGIIFGVLKALLGEKYKFAIALILGMAVMMMFNHYSVEPLLQKLLQEKYRVRYLVIPDLLALVLAYLISKSRTVHYAFLATIFSSSLLSLAMIKKSDVHSSQLPIQEYTEFTQVATNSTHPKPNVYFIVPDAFDGPENFNKMSAQKLSIHQDLEKRHFTVVHDAYSNGTATLLSLPQVYSMNYLFKDKDFISGKKITELDKLYLNESPTTREFQRRGYKFYRFADGMTGDCVGTEDKCFRKRNYYTIQDMVFADRTLIPRNIEYILFGSKGRIPGKMEMDEFIPLIPDPSEGPFFLIGHFSMPHPPFRFDESCNAISYGSAFSSWQAFLNTPPGEARFKIYQGQALCAQSMLLKVVDAIKAKDPNAIIVIQADHGLQTFDFTQPITQLSRDNLLESFNVLYAFHGPESLTKHLYDGMSPVNTFRLIFAWLDNQEPQLLNHRAFYGEWQNDGRAYIVHEWHDAPVPRKDKA